MQHIAPQPRTDLPPPVDSEMREFARVLRQALLMVVRYLEARYDLGSKARS